MADEGVLYGRIQKLERSNSIIKFVIGLLTIALAISLFSDRIWPRSRVFAKQFVLTDESGKITAKLGADGIGTCLQILGTAKSAIAELCAGDNLGSSLALTDRHGEARAILTAGMKTQESIGESLPPSLVIVDSRTGHSIESQVGSEAKVTIGRSDGDSSIILSDRSPASPILMITGSGKKKIWSAP
jgi:hypothetical protein